MKKILFFDTWIVGTRYMYKYAEFLKSNYEVFFLSMSNHMAKSSRMIAQTISDFKSNDSHFYKHIFNGIYDFSDFNSSISEAIQEIKPDLIITISLHGFEHRYVNEIATYNNIPCIMYMHGLRSNETDVIRSLHFNKIFHYVGRGLYFTYLYNCYLHDLKKYPQVKIDYLIHSKRLFSLLFSNSAFTNSPSDNLGLNYHTIHVLNIADIDYYRNNYWITSTTTFKVTSHSDMIDFCDYLSANNLNYIEHNTSIFISQPFVNSGLLSYAEYEAVILASKQLSDKLGLKFFVRAHPRDDFDVLKKICNNNNLSISDSSLYDDVLSSRLFFGFNSTLFLQVMAFNKAIVFFDVLQSVRTPSYFNEYRNGFKVNNLEDLSDNLTEITFENTMTKEIDYDFLKHLDPREAILTTVKEVLCQD